ARFANATALLEALPRPPSHITASLALGALVREALETRAASPSYAPTVRATQVATQVLGERPPRALEVIPAGPEETTRTTPRAEGATEPLDTLVPLAECTVPQPLRRRGGG